MQHIITACKMPRAKSFNRGHKKFHKRNSDSFSSSIPREVLPTCRHALPLPISTRGIGFAVSYTYTFLSRFRHFRMSIYQLYRASLIQFQVRLFEASESMFKHQIIPKDYNNMHMSLKDRKFVTREAKNFKMIATVLNSFGPFGYDDISYQPYLPETECPDPFNVTILNLRETVVALSSSTANTKEARWAFYQHNSIPGAKWEVNESTMEARLTNPNEIIPVEFDISDDYNQFVDAIMMINQEYFNHIGTVNYSGKGRPSQLVSIKETCTSRIPNCEKVDQEGSTKYQHLPPIDSEVIAYAFGELDDTDMFLGLVSLYGEHCQNKVDYETWGCRSDQNGSSSISYSWESCAFSILNDSSKNKYTSDSGLKVPTDFSVGNFALPIPISSRGIGFAVAYIYSTLSEYKNLQIDIYQLYRASLLQFQYRIFKSAEYKFKHLVVPKKYFKMFQQISDPRYICPNKNNFKLISTIINCFGPFQEQNVEYHPCLPESSILNPFTVTIENLRQTVVALSSNVTDQKASRWLFYKHNSIPGAVWKVDRGNEDAVLTNPDDIMPANYAPVNDLEALAKCMSVMETKESEYIGTLKYLGRGSSCQLVSIYEQCTDSIPSSEKIIAENSTTYRHFAPVTKGIVAHARKDMSTKDMILGIISMYGEFCQHTVDYEVWGCRSQSNGSCSVPVTLWKTLARYCVKLDIN